MTDGEPLQLLLIEDNPGDARYIQELLREAPELSIRVEERTGEGADSEGEQPPPALFHETRLADGLERLDEQTIDAVLLDLDLPDSDGLATLSSVVDAADVPIVVLTGQSDRDVGTTALREGAEEYLVKDEINADLLVRSLYHAIERRANERELKRYEIITEEATDVNAILDLDGTFQYVTPSVSSILGYEQEDLVGESAYDYVHPDDQEAVLSAVETILDDEPVEAVEFRYKHANGDWVILEGRGRNLRDDPLVQGVAVYTRDVTERVRRKERLERQRERLAALNDLYAVVRDINEALVEQSTREEIEDLVVDRLASSDSYRFAWIGEVDLPGSDVVTRTEAGVEDYLSDVDISIDADAETSQGPTARAIQSGEMQVVNDAHSDPAYEPWRDRAEDYGYQSSAAIPITHQGTLYGVLNVYANRPSAFEDEERAVIGQLGSTVGHAINAIERKQVLQGAEVLEVEFTAQGYLGAHDVEDADGRITFERAVPIGGGRYVVFGTATEPALQTLDALTESVDHWDDVTVGSDGPDGYRFELDFSQPPVLSRIAEKGGRLHRAVIEDGDYHLTIHLSPGADVRRIADAIQEALPSARLIAQRRTEMDSGDLPAIRGDLEERLTVRQRNVLEAAFHAGFFEWPREQNGEDVAETLDVSAPTFHQHLRAGERKVLESIFGSE